LLSSNKKFRILILFTVSLLSPAGSKCGNYNRNCEEWARIGECTKNPDYMTIYCPQACHSCHGGMCMIKMSLAYNYKFISTEGFYKGMILSNSAC
jgi:hypothetical protein